MRITIKNNVSGLEFHFLDQQEIYARYGNEKVTLDEIDFINNKDLNLSTIGGNGGLFALPNMEGQGYSRNFSQNYNFLDTKYEQRTIELGTYIPAFLILGKNDLYDYINAVLFEDGTTLKLIIDMRNDGGRVNIVSNVSCTESPLQDYSSNFTFLVWGDSANSFKSLPIIYELSPITGTNELKYAKEYAIFYEESQASDTVVINNPFAFDLDFIIYIKGGIATDPLITNETTGEFVGYNGAVAINDDIIIRSDVRNITKNGITVIGDLAGDFFKLSPGENKLKLTFNTFDGVNPPKTFIEYQEVYKNV